MIKRKVTARPIEKRKNMYRLILQVKGDLPETMIKRILEEVFNKKPEETEAVLSECKKSGKVILLAAPFPIVLAKKKEVSDILCQNGKDDEMLYTEMISFK